MYTVICMCNCLTWGCCCLTLLVSHFLLQDETALIWYSHKREKFLRLSSVSKVIPGQRTVCLLLSELNGKILLASIYIASTTADMVRGACKVQQLLYQNLAYVPSVHEHLNPSYTMGLICLTLHQAVFRRFLRPEKDYLSFSLIYKNGQRSLDLVKIIL